MAKMSKEERARQEGMDYAYRLVKAGGIEALEKRISRNIGTNVPCCMSDHDLKEFCNRTKQTVTTSMAALVCLVLRDKFQWGKIWIGRFADHFYSYCECIEGGWLAWDDCTKMIKDEVGIDLEIYRNDTDMVLNHHKL